MEPKLPVGSLIYVKQVDFNELNIGDSITYYLDDSTIVATHEILKINNEDKKFVTYGINNKNENEEILKDAAHVEYRDIIGKVIFCIPYLGFVNRFITSSKGICILIIIITLIIIIDGIKKRQ